MNIMNDITAVDNMAQKPHFIGWERSNKNRIVHNTHTHMHSHSYLEK